jgi:hypothetical protein
MYLKCFFAMKGNLTSRVIASAASQTNVHSDAAGFGGWVGSHQARYKQAIRHMWGSLDTGYAFIRVAETIFAPDFCDVESEADSDGDSPYMSPVASVSGLEDLSVHWIHYILLFSRLFEAHFLPVHLIALAIASTLFKLFASAESRARELAWEFEFDGYLRILGFLGVVSMFFMYRRYHLICTQARREEMQRAGLEGDLNEEFRDWPLLTYIVDSCKLRTLRFEKPVLTFGSSHFPRWRSHLWCHSICARNNHAFLHFTSDVCLFLISNLAR